MLSVNTNIFGRNHLLICYSNRFLQEQHNLQQRLQQRKKQVSCYVLIKSAGSIEIIILDIIKAKFEKLFSTKSNTDKLTTDELTQSICRITTFYQKLIQTLTELRLQILCGMTKRKRENEFETNFHPEFQLYHCKTV